MADELKIERAGDTLKIHGEFNEGLRDILTEAAKSVSEELTR